MTEWKMTDWRPIETAAKDGESILGYCEKEELFEVIFWCNYEDDGTSWCSQVWGQKKGWNTNSREIFDATHWMPLPKPPKKKHSCFVDGIAVNRNEVCVPEDNCIDLRARGICEECQQKVIDAILKK